MSCFRGCWSQQPLANVMLQVESRCSVTPAVLGVSNVATPALTSALLSLLYSIRAMTGVIRATESPGACRIPFWDPIIAVRTCVYRKVKHQTDKCMTTQHCNWSKNFACNGCSDGERVKLPCNGEKVCPRCKTSFGSGGKGRHRVLAGFDLPSAAKMEACAQNTDAN